MKFKIGDVVTRKSHNNDIVFKIISISEDKVYLKGIDVRLYADAYIDDLVQSKEIHDDESIIEENLRNLNINRDNYFYLPGKILHIDGDNEYLDRCMNFYKSLGIKANGLTIKEDNIKKRILSLLNDYKPDILVITGHDAFYSKNGDKSNSNISLAPVEFKIVGTPI